MPDLGIPDGNPPSGVASGYIWFDVMALLIAPLLVPLVSPRARRRRRAAATPRRDIHSRVSATPRPAEPTSASRAPSRRQSSVKPRGAASVCATSSTPRARPVSSSR